MNIVIVESPAKAKTINKYLGTGFEVLASYGHIRDLPPKDGSVRPGEDFAMSWQVDGKANARLSQIAKAVKSADRLILATDPDREGEAISWHLLEVLKEKKAIAQQRIDRVVFNAITKSAVLEAMDNPRQIDLDLVDAYRARRALDYLVGFTLSPVLWRKLPGARSAGRVQSVALRMVCQREQEIEQFNPQEYWTVDARLATATETPLKARLVDYDGEKLGRLDIKTQTQAAGYAAMLEAAQYTVDNVQVKPQKRRPQPPFTTSTLQQEASRKLGFSATATMRTAQKLYEGIDIGGGTVGLITYMRTDGVQVAGEAISAARAAIGGRYGAAYLPEKPIRYTTKAKNSQEAHEAIRPTDPGRAPEDVQRYLQKDEFALYQLIWRRMLASQMAEARFERTAVSVAAIADSHRAMLRANGSVLKFDGFLVLYQEGADDEAQSDDGQKLPPLASGDVLSRRGIDAAQHFTEPPPRYSEATLVKQMEALGIGRPSTYASTLQTLHDRDYVFTDKKRIHPNDKGRLVTAFLESFFNSYVAYDFTADLEDRLDRISAGALDWKQVLAEFWNDFSSTVGGVKDLRVSQVLDTLNELLAAHIFPDGPDGANGRKCPKCDNGMLSIKTSRFGAFVGCENYPDCAYTRPLTNDGGAQQAALDEPRILGSDPQSDEDVSLRNGRFGPYVQLGEGTKPKRASLPRDWPPDSIDLARALSLLALPRTVGPHPQDGKPILAGLGRYGPYVLHNGVYGRLTSVDEVFTVGANRAVDLLESKRGKKSGGAIRELGDHPEGGAIGVYDGRYGPYAKWGKVNATIPKNSDPATLSLEDAVQLVNAQAAKAKTKKKTTTRKPSATKRTARKKPAASKPPAEAG